MARTILLVDDEPAVRAVACKMVRRLGYEVVDAQNGDQAIQILLDHPGKIDLAIIDLTMPHLDGEQTLKKLRELKPDLPAILASGHSETEMASKYRHAGFSAFIQKPFLVAALNQKLREVLPPDAE